MKFKAAIPLMECLKNESLRTRHWQLLMEKTSYNFDTNNGTFQMKHVFDMKLYNHKVKKKEE